jgi:hypothetical protein
MIEINMVMSLPSSRNDPYDQNFDYNCYLKTMTDTVRGKLRWCWQQWCCHDGLKRSIVQKLKCEKMAVKISV